MNSKRNRQKSARAVAFQTPLCRNCLVALALATQRSEKGRLKEALALDAGKAIQSGDHSLAHIETIARWKSARPIGIISSNDQVTISGVLRATMDADSVAQKIYALTTLRGVGVPMASAILTAIDPKTFCVIDVRALDSLGARGTSPTIPLYERYLSFCRMTAERLEMPLRDLDRALWKAGTP